MRSTTPRRINPARGRNSYTYIRGSAAPAYPQEEYIYRPDGRPARKKPKPVPRVTENYTRCRDAITPALINVVLMGFVVAVCALLVLGVNAKVSAMRSEIKQTQALTQRTNAANDRLENMLSQAVDMDEVKLIATTRLGMQTAAPHQMVTINVKKDSYSVQYEDPVADSKNKTFLEKIGLK